MKRIISILLVLILFSCSIAFAQKNTNIQAASLSNQRSNEATQLQNKTRTVVMLKQKEKLRARTTSELREMTKQKQQEMNQQMKTLRKEKQKIYKNQNRVRLAVHSLLAMEDLVGGIGPQVREIAREFNNSIKETIQEEERIQARRGLLKFLIGGHKNAAEKLEEKVNRNQERIQRLRDLMESCDCNEEVKAMMREQIQNMEQEQDRLQEVAGNEKKNKGLFGWIWK